MPTTSWVAPEAHHDEIPSPGTKFKEEKKGGNEKFPADAALWKGREMHLLARDRSLGVTAHWSGSACPRVFLFFRYTTSPHPPITTIIFWDKDTHTLELLFCVRVCKGTCIFWLRVWHLVYCHGVGSIVRRGAGRAHLWGVRFILARVGPHRSINFLHEWRRQRERSILFSVSVVYL